MLAGETFVRKQVEARRQQAIDRFELRRSAIKAIGRRWQSDTKFIVGHRKVVIARRNAMGYAEVPRVDMC